MCRLCSNVLAFFLLPTLRHDLLWLSLFSQIVFPTISKPNAQWANNEAQARLDLQAAGKLDKPEFGTLYNTPEGTGVASDWDDFMTKAIKPGEDDDDDDDDEDGDDEDDEDDDEDEEDE